MDAKARGDSITLSTSEIFDESLAAVTRKSLVQRTTHYYIVSGSSFPVVNGRFLPSGTMTGAIKYVNVRGWELFRLHLLEIPEMGIYAENCYDINKGPSLSSIADARAAVSESAIIRPEAETGLREGTAKFQRNYTEVTRAGIRFKIADQTVQMVSTAVLRDVWLRVCMYVYLYLISQ
jgi:hypothetical protein